MPCSQRRFQNQCGGGMRFHPYMMMAGAMPHLHPFFMNHHAENGDTDDDVAAHLHLSTNKSRWTELEDTYTFQMDVPGVKARHVTIEEKDGEMEVTALRMTRNGEEVIKTYQEVLYVRSSTTDLAKAVATLHDGVLTITVPKKKSPEPVDIAVETDSLPPAETMEGTEFRVSLDLPGVKANDIKVQVRRNLEEQPKVYLEASRKLDGRTMKMRRLLQVEPPNADMARASAFLQDGVFTLAAPIPANDHDDENNEGKPSAMRTIMVTDGDEVPSVADLNLNEEEKTKESGKMVVETVAEGENGWEEVNDDVKAPPAAESR